MPFRLFFIGFSLMLDVLACRFLWNVGYTYVVFTWELVIFLGLHSTHYWDLCLAVCLDFSFVMKVIFWTRPFRLHYSFMYYSFSYYLHSVIYLIYAMFEEENPLQMIFLNLTIILQFYFQMIIISCQVFLYVGSQWLLLS